jgi:hypothetical protein
MEVSGVPGHVTGHDAPGLRAASANNTRRVEAKSTEISQARPANPQAISTGKIFVAGHQQTRTDVLEGYGNSKETGRDANSQQREALQTGSNTDHSDSITVFPWNMAAKLDTTQPEVTFLVYNSNHDGNDTNEWNSDGNDYGSLIGDMAEKYLLESENEKNDYLTETTTAFSNIGQAFDTDTYKREMEYLVASGSENKGIREDIEMQQDSEDDRNDGDEDEEDNVDEGEPLVHGHALRHDIYNKGPNTPKRSFVSENLKMRISQLATGEQRRKLAADGTQSRHRTWPRSGQPSRATTRVDKQTASRKESLTNRPRAPALLAAKPILRNPNTQLQSYENLPDMPVGGKTARSQPLQLLRSKAKHLTTSDQDRTTNKSRASESQETPSGQVDINDTAGSVAETSTSQPERSGLRQVPAKYHMQENGPEMTFPRKMQVHLKRHSEIMAELANEGRRNTNTDLFTIRDNRTVEEREMLAADTKSTGTDDVKTSENARNGAVEHSRCPAVVRTATGTSRSTFGARTRTRDRTAHVTTKAAGGGHSTGTIFVQNQHEDRGVAEMSSSQSAGVATPPGITLASTLEMDTSGSAHGDTSVEGTGLINIIGPIPKGFTDPATTQDVDIASGPLFHLPYNIPPEPFWNDIPKPIVPLIATPVSPSESARTPSSGVTSSNNDAKVFRQPHAPAITAMSNSPKTSHVSPHEWHSHFSASQGQSSLPPPTSDVPPTREVAEFRQPSPFHSPPTKQPEAATSPHIAAALVHSFQDDPAALVHSFQDDPAALVHSSQDDPAALVHSFKDDPAITAKIVPLPQITSVQKFLSFADQQLRQPGVESQQSPKHPAESRPAPHLFALYQQDAVRHAAQVEYTNKLREYFQHLLNYNNQQRRP